MMELLDSYLPVFKKALHIVDNPSEFSGYAESRLLCIKTLEQARSEANQCDVEEEEKAAAYFAVIAWLDELMLCSELPWRQQWQGERLQRKYLNTTLAGAHFFQRLTALDVGHQQARKVFLFCLQNGFHGQYGTVDDRSDLLALIEEQRKQCLQENWWAWPCDTPVASGIPDKKIAITRHKSLLPVVISGALFLYGALFFLFRYYVM
ncbi:DotU family type IV/VI secretion system protein [Citrobacter youngae]|uniref:Type IV / VI secretion system protein, DotU family n=1 Tax=Citrobacter youngae ATCC 29220 TaxID=500640 RepID=D4B7R0_9ENTR|nr:DotU family type IV/VI secretion system protein [Citrobacter youngae]EFE10413.1 type IV / VI secretion system protein, DotU family [Citrobacter youngae ATCC 29220]